MNIIQQYNEFLIYIQGFNPDPISGYDFKKDMMNLLLKGQFHCKLTRECDGYILYWHCYYNLKDYWLKTFKSRQEAKTFCSKFDITYTYQE
jgi:hypothetical protein